MSAFFTNAYSFFHLLRWRLTWTRYDLDLVPRGVDSTRFISARAAAALIPDGSVVASGGITGNSRCSIFYFAVKDRFVRTGHPNNLTWIAQTAQGGRGKIPGTIEELGIKGLITRHITAHAETHKTLLKLIDQGHMTLHNLPQGAIAHLYEAQARGETSIQTRAGVGTFLDPRVGPGTAVFAPAHESLVRARDERLEFTMPKAMICFLALPYADAQGNLYIRDVACFNEALEMARATRANGGKVVASVAKVIDPDQETLFLRADEVDHIVVNPWNEQTTSVRQLRPWNVFMAGSRLDPAKEIKKVTFINRVLRVTPRRDAPEHLVARLAAWKFVNVVPRSSLVNIGVGLPEEVARTLVESGHYRDVTFITECGAVGGLPAPGLFFGAALAPERVIGSAETFRLLREKLDVAVLGMVEADELGNVNISRRGPRATQFVGVGGFCDITSTARKIIFVGNWMNGGRFEVTPTGLRIDQLGTVKFQKRVSEITFSGQEALRRGKEIYFVSQVGIFQLTPNGLVATHLTPGVDFERDISRPSGIAIAPPDPKSVAELPHWVLTGQGAGLPRMAVACHPT